MHEYLNKYSQSWRLNVIIGLSGFFSLLLITRTSLVSGSILTRVCGSKLPFRVGFAASDVDSTISPNVNCRWATWNDGSDSRIRVIRGTFIRVSVELHWEVTISSDNKAIRIPIAADEMEKWVIVDKSGRQRSITNWNTPGGIVTRASTWLISWHTRLSRRSLFARFGSLNTQGTILSSISSDRIKETVSSKHMEQILSWRDSEKWRWSWRCTLFWIWIES